MLFSVDEEPISLEDRAIIKDIETSNLAELNVWAKSIGLSTGTNISSVQRAIAKYYKLSLSSKKTEETGKIITIERAELSTYYTLEEVDESVAEFEGRVQIVIDDTEQEIQHSIIADKVNFNRTLNSVTALGNVEYIKTEQGKPELVTAESLTFNLSNWKGSLLKCISKQDKVIGEEDMVFYYVTGEIKKSDTEVMGMKDVTIQTVEGSPYFNISALNLWMLDSSDFVIILPTIKVGNVPVFIAPFYYHTENSLYFNPVFGIKSREGTTFQNTLYLMGSKPQNEEESDFSFLSFDNGDAAGNMELNGMTLVPSDDKTSYSTDYSKMMFDYYSNLGLFIGNSSQVDFDSIKTDIEFDGGLGFSRNIDDSDGTIFIDEESDWNSSYIWGNEVPFRYMIDLSISSPIVDVEFKSYSDIYFRTDFYNREEDFKWVDYFTEQLDDGIESLSDDDDTYTRDTDTESSITSYDISVDFTKFSPEVDFLNPFISSFSFDLKEITLDYSSKIAYEYDDDAELETIYEDYDPSYKFFYPDTLTIPITLSIAGQFFDTTFEGNTTEDKYDSKNNYTFDNPLFDIKNPTLKETEESESDDKLESNEIFTLEKDDLFSDESSSTTKSDGLIWSNLDYSASLPFNLYGYWDDDEWNNALDVEYDLDESSILYNFDPNGSLEFDLGVLNSFFTIENTLEGYIYSKAYLEADDQDNLEDVYEWNKTLVENELKLELDLFKLMPWVDKHSLNFTYELNTLLYKVSFDEDAYEEAGSDEPFYLTEEFEWTEDFIYDNEISGEYNYTLDFSETTLGYSKILPPFDDEDSVTVDQQFKFEIFKILNNTSETSLEYNRTLETDDDDDTEELIEVYSASETYTISIAETKTSIDFGFDFSESYLTDDDDDTEDEWEFSPIELGFEYKPSDFVSISIGSEYNIEDEVWDEYSAGLTIGDLDLELVSSYDQPLTWDSDDQSWESDSDADEELLLDYLTIEHNYKIKEFHFWKNRITLDIDSDLTITKEFIEVDDSELKYTLDFTLDIYDFLTFELSTTSKNSALYQYWESDYTELGLSSGKNIITDLLKSFNLFSETDREESSFNLYSIQLDATYKMPDWNLVFSYTGEPELEDYEYTWYQVFSFFIEWKPLSLVRSDVENDDDDWSVSTSSTEE